MNNDKVFKKHPENLAPSFTVFRVSKNTAIVPVAVALSGGAVCALKPTSTDKEWLVGVDDVYEAWPIVFDCPAENSFHGKTIHERFHNTKDSYLIRLPETFKDSWRIKEIIGFVLFAQDLYAYR